MSWIKTLWLWEEVALCLLLGLSLVWGHMWWVAGVLVPAAWDSRRCPVLIWFDFFFFCSPAPLASPMFYSRMTARTRHRALWLAVPAPRAGRTGRARPVQKEKDTKTHIPAGLTHTPLSAAPSGQSATERRCTSAPQLWGCGQIE